MTTERDETYDLFRGLLDTAADQKAYAGKLDAKFAAELTELVRARPPEIPFLAVLDTTPGEGERVYTPDAARWHRVDTLVTARFVGEIDGLSAEAVHALLRRWWEGALKDLAFGLHVHGAVAHGSAQIELRREAFRVRFSAHVPYAMPKKEEVSHGG